MLRNTMPALQKWGLTYYYIYIYIYIRTPDSVSLASLARQLGMCSFSTVMASELAQKTTLSKESQVAEAGIYELN